MGKRSREKKEKRERELEIPKKKFYFQTTWEKTCLFIIRWGTYLVLFTPLIINTKFFFPFVAPKTIFFRIIIEIILLFYIFLVITNRRWRPRINALTIALTLFLGIFILASFTGVNLERSFWSTNERMTGIWTMLHLFAFFIILSSCFREKKEWEKILGVSVIVGVLLSLYILMGSEISTRGGGTIGNTSFMAAYLLFDIFFAIILFFSKRGGWQIFSGLSLAIMLPVLFTSSARGAIISFFVGLFLLFLGYLTFSQRKKLKKLALGIVLLLIIFGITSAVFQPVFITEKVGATLKEMNSRFVVWEKGWQGFQERPILGWGPENFNVVFNKNFNPCMFMNECGGEIWFDRTHNIIFDTLVTTGIIGLISYLSIFIIAIYGVLRVTSRVVERKNIFIPLGLAVLLMVYFVQNLLVFDMINTYLVFFLSLAFINFLTQKPVAEERIEARQISPILGSIIIIVMICVLWLGNIQPVIANYYIIKMVGSQDVAEASLFFQKSLDSWMEKYEPREHFAQKMIKVPHQSLIPEENRQAFQKAFDLAESEMEKSIIQNYLDFRHYLFLGELYNISYRFSGSKEKLERSEQVLGRAIQLSPRNQQGYWQMAETKLAQGKIAEVIPFLKTAVDLEPRIGYSHWYLAIGYKIAGDYRLALDELFKAEETGYDVRSRTNDLEELVELYRALENDQEVLASYDRKLVQFYLDGLRVEPDNANAWFLLAVSYANLGQFEKAREAAQKVIENNPDLQLKVEEFLKTLP